MDIYIPQEHEIGGRGLESRCLLWWTANAFDGITQSADLTVEEMTLCYTAPIGSPKAAVLRVLAKELDATLFEREDGCVHAGSIGFRNDEVEPAERVRAFRAAVESCGHNPK